MPWFPIMHNQIKSQIHRLVPVLLCCLFALFIFPPLELPAQGIGGVGGGGVGGGVGGGAGGVAGGAAGGAQGNRGGGGAQAAGIMVDAQGVVAAIFAPDNTGKLAQKRREAEARKTLPADMNVYAPMRKVSLVQLEQACESYSKKKENPTQEMQYLAGLQRIDYIFVLPETNDLVLAGPAEGFAFDPVGRAVGVTTGRPPLRLDDLIVALRALERGGTLGCSIDPKPDNLKRLNDYLAQNSFPASADVAKSRYPQMAKALGMQDVRIWGIPAESHFAEVLVEADYRMKLISVGLETTPVKTLKSHLSMLGANGNSMQRWWFIPLYDSCLKSEDGLAYQLVGQRTQLSSQEEVVDQGGQRSAAAVTRVSTQKFAQHFTEKFPELANVSPAFAELQSLIDLAVVAALFKKDQLPRKVGWKMALFLDEEKALLAKRNVPRQVPSVANFKSAGKVIVGLVGGGVTVNPLQTANNLEYRSDSDGKLKSTRTRTADQMPPAEHPWWWD